VGSCRETGSRNINVGTCRDKGGGNSNIMLVLVVIQVAETAILYVFFRDTGTRKSNNVMRVRVVIQIAEK